MTVPPSRREPRLEEVSDTPNAKLWRISTTDVACQPDAYRNNTKKEELMLE